MKSLDQWLPEIEKLHPQNIDLGLARIAKVAEQLGLTKFNCPVITVGGTNGKGSCVKTLESIFLAAGYKTGAYTSPHLLKFNERIRINNQMIDDASLSEAFEIITQHRNSIPLTFFEFTTLAALEIFRAQNLDVLILEVGLGGRLDAVNIVEPDISILTTIELDHMDWLGNTREEIAIQKAGIFRPLKPAIIGDKNPPAKLLEQAHDLNAQLYCINTDFSYETTQTSWTWQSKASILSDLPLPNLPMQNVATALMAIDLFPKAISNSAIIEGINNAWLPGRFQKIVSPACILDVAHNPAAANLLASNIKNLKVSGNIKAVIGMLADKDIPNTLQPLLPFVKEWHLTHLPSDRTASASTLASHLQDFGQVSWYTYNNVSDAFNAAKNSLTTEDLIVVFGSFYTVAAVLNLFQNH